MRKLTSHSVTDKLLDVNGDQVLQPNTALSAPESVEMSLDARIESILDAIGGEIAACGSEVQAEHENLAAGDTASNIELSIVMPCLNEADTLEACLDKAQRALAELEIASEIIVADNGSTDGSREIALQRGVRLVDVPDRGYGAALMGGIEASRGEYVLMGDADDSYDFGEIPRFHRRLKDGAELVQGCRLPSGGGRVMPGAMPWLHRWIGNPMLTWLAVNMFRAPVNDVYCGMRAFRRDWYQRLGLRCTGMEFAVEMIVKGSLFPTKISQVPIRLHPDGRRSRRPHLRTFRDGWRTLRFFLLHSPLWTFLVPGIVVALIGAIGCVLSLPQMQIGNIVFDVHTLLISTLAILVGTQLISCAVLAKTFAAGAKLLPIHAQLDRLLQYWTLERRLAVCATMFSVGTLLIGWTTWNWMQTGFGALDYAITMRQVIPGVGLIALAGQFASASFLISVLRMDRR